VDPVLAWRDAFDRVCALVERLDDAELDARVPACPDWTVRDLLAHMVGLGVDVLAGDEPDDHNSAWTQRRSTPGAAGRRTTCSPSGGTPPTL